MASVKISSKILTLRALERHRNVIAVLLNRLHHSGGSQAGLLVLNKNRKLCALKRAESMRRSWLESAETGPSPWVLTMCKWIEDSEGYTLRTLTLLPSSDLRCYVVM